MKTIIKTYEELTKDELFDILKLRSDVFVAEQNSAYPDVEDNDKKCTHVMLTDDDGLLAYLRVLPKGMTMEETAIGRVIAAKRGKGYGKEAMLTGLKVAKERYGADCVMIEAQVQAKGFYEKLGFRQISDVFDDAGIPHIRMITSIY